ncbi:MAG: WYL domain-containing protein [Planctomycetaceae bacterium]
MPNESSLTRQWRLLQVLSARRQGVTVRELSAELEVVDKTIRRDLLQLARTGFPLLETSGDHGRKSWKLDTSPGIASLKFNLTELMALYLGRRFLEPLAGTNIWTGAQSAFKKIRATLGKAPVDYLDKLSHVFHQTPLAAGDYSKHAELIESLLIAIEDRKIAGIAYQSARATEPVSTEVYPLVMLWHRGSLYLLAHAPDEEKVKTYKVDRISNVNLSSHSFTLPEEFDASQYLASSFGILQGDGTVTAVRVRFDATVARYVTEKKWHSSQQSTLQRDGSLLVDFQLGDLRELQAWLLSFGQHAEVLEPESLRLEIAERIQAMLNLYSPAESEQAPRNPRGLPR